MARSAVHLPIIAEAESRSGPPISSETVAFGSRTVVLAPTWLGDTVMALPVLEAIAESRAQGVDVLAPASMERFLKATRLFRLVLPSSDSFFGDRRILAVGGYDEAFVLPHSWRSALLPFLAHVEVRRGCDRDGRGILLTDRAGAPDRARHQVNDYDALLLDVGLDRASDVPRFRLPPGFVASGRRKLEEVGIDPDRAFVGFNPGGLGTERKRWPIERFAAIASELRGAGVPAVVYCGRTEEPSAKRIAAAVSPALPVLGSDEDVLGLASFLAPCRLLVTNDSGAMHLAAALGVRCVALFGPTDPARTAPLGPDHRIVRGETMESIDPDVVAAALFEELHERRTTGASRRP